MLGIDRVGKHFIFLFLIAPFFVPEAKAVENDVTPVPGIEITTSDDVTVGGTPGVIQTKIDLIDVNGANDAIKATDFVEKVTGDALAENPNVKIAVANLDHQGDKVQPVFVGEGPESVAKGLQTARKGVFSTIRDTFKRKDSEAWKLIVSRFTFNGGVTALTLSFHDHAPTKVSIQTFLILGAMSGGLMFFNTEYRNFLVQGRMTDSIFRRLKVEPLLQKFDATTLGKFLAETDFKLFKKKFRLGPWRQVDTKTEGRLHRTFRTAEEWVKWYLTEVFFYGIFSAHLMYSGFIHYPGLATAIPLFFTNAISPSAGQAPWDLANGVEAEMYKRKYVDDLRALEHVEKVHARLTWLNSVVSTGLGGYLAIGHSEANYALFTLGALGALNYLRVKWNENRESFDPLSIKVWDPPPHAPVQTRNCGDILKLTNY